MKDFQNLSKTHSSKICQKFFIILSPKNQTPKKTQMKELLEINLGNTNNINNFGDVSDSEILDMRSSPSNLTLESYTIKRLESFGWEVTSLALMLFTRLVLSDRVEFKVESGFKPLAACFMIAHKLSSDQTYTAKQYKKLLSFPVQTMRELEVFVVEKGLDYFFGLEKLKEFKRGLSDLTLD